MITRTNNNSDIKIAMLQENIKHYELARKLKIASTSLSRKLRYTISQEEKERLLKAIEEIKKENNK